MWPNVEVTNLNLAEPVLGAPSVQNFGIADPAGVYTHGVPGPTGDRLRAGDRDIPLPPIALWPRSVRLVALSPTQLMPAPARENFRYSKVWRAPSFAQSARKPMPQRKLHVTAETAAAKKETTGSVTRNSAAPRPPRPTGHQIQLPPKPTAELVDSVIR